MTPGPRTRTYGGVTWADRSGRGPWPLRRDLARGDLPVTTDGNGDADVELTVRRELTMQFRTVADCSVPDLCTVAAYQPLTGFLAPTGPVPVVETPVVVNG